MCVLNKIKYRKLNSIFFSQDKSIFVVQASETHDSHVCSPRVGRVRERVERTVREVHVRLSSVRHQHTPATTNRGDTRSTSNVAHIQGERHGHDGRRRWSHLGQPQQGERGARRFSFVEGRWSRVQKDLYEVQTMLDTGRVSTLCVYQLACLL